VGLKEEQYIQLFRSTTSMISFRDRLCYEIDIMTRFRANLNQMNWPLSFLGYNPARK